VGFWASATVLLTSTRFRKLRGVGWYLVAAYHPTLIKTLEERKPQSRVYDENLKKTGNVCVM
jgi:hypothetical protein